MLNQISLTPPSYIQTTCQRSVDSSFTLGETTSSSTRSGQRRLRQETTTTLPSNLVNDLDLEKKADLLMEKTSFYSEWAKYDHYENIAHLYGEAALSAQTSGNYERAATLYLKEAHVYVEKLNYLRDAISTLKKAHSSFRSQNQFGAAEILYQELVVLFDGIYNQLQDAKTDSDWRIHQRIANNRIEKAALYEESGIDCVEWQKLYKEAADLLLTMEDDDALYNKDAALTCKTVAAMCLEKIPEELHNAKSMYKEGLSVLVKWYQDNKELFETPGFFVEPINTSTSSTDSIYPERFKQLLLMQERFFLLKGGKFLAIKAENPDACALFSEVEMSMLENFIFTQDWTGIYSDKGLALICLHKIATASLIEYLENFDPIRAEAIQKRADVLNYFTASNLDTKQLQQLEEISKAKELQNLIDVYQNITSLNDYPVEDQIRLLSTGIPF